MTVLHAYTSTFNDIYMIQFYVRHWAQYASKIFVYDDDSTDGTREFCQSMAPLVELKSPGFHGIDEILLQEMRNREYKLNSRGVADWCVIGDSDEFHYHPNMLAKLDELKQAGCLAVISHGYQMFSEVAPQGEVQMMDTVKTGIPDHIYDRVIFNPQIDISIGIGHHGFTIENVNYREFIRAGQRIATSPPDLQSRFSVLQNDHAFKMLHYKYLSREHVKERHNRVWSRSSDRNKKNGWGAHLAPDWNSYYGISWYEKKLKEAKPCLG
jgi:hypothetical protein